MFGLEYVYIRIMHKVDATITSDVSDTSLESINQHGQESPPVRTAIARIRTSTQRTISRAAILYRTTQSCPGLGSTDTHSRHGDGFSGSTSPLLVLVLASWFCFLNRRSSPATFYRNYCHSTGLARFCSRLAQLHFYLV